MQSPISNTIFLMQNISDQLRTLQRSVLHDRTSSLSEALARISVLWGTEQDCGARQAPSSAMRSRLSRNSGLTFLSGRTLREYSSQDIAQIFGALSKRLPTLAVIDSNGNCLILHGFYPRAERECTLSDVLQRNVPERYFLSFRRVRSMVKANKTRFIPMVAEP